MNCGHFGTSSREECKTEDVATRKIRRSKNNRIFRNLNVQIEPPVGSLLDMLTNVFTHSAPQHITNNTSTQHIHYTTLFTLHETTPHHTTRKKHDTKPHEITQYNQKAKQKKIFLSPRY